MPALFIQSSLMLPGQYSSLCHVEAELCDCRNFCQLSTWVGDPRVLGPHNQRQPVPWTHPLSCSPRDGHWKPPGRDSWLGPYSVCAEPPGDQKWRQPGTWKAQTQRRQAVFQDMTVSTERRSMACFLRERGSSRRSNEDSLLMSSRIYSGSCGERLRWQRERETNCMFSSWRLYCATKFYLDEALEVAIQIDPGVRGAQGGQPVPRQCEESSIGPKLACVISSSH